MSKVILPYILREGQIAYASRVMANLNAIIAKLNNVSIPGLMSSDVEQALIELKALIDAEAKAQNKTLTALEYDSSTHMLQIELKDGALFQLSMAPFINDYSGTDSESIATFVDGTRTIIADIKDGGVSYQKLSAALQQIIDNKIIACEPGNAKAICFEDGSTMQEKLDNNEFNGKDGVSVALDAIYYFRVGEDGHLYIGVADGAAQPPFSIDVRGHLIYTIE